MVHGLVQARVVVGSLDRIVSTRGPLIFDELPCLVSSSPELPSVMQRWVDRDAEGAGPVVAVAGASQRMMQGPVLSAEAPPYGRARELLEIHPLDPSRLRSAFTDRDDAERVEAYAAWGGVPRHGELAADLEVRPILDEARWSPHAFTMASLGRALRALNTKPEPSLPARTAHHDVVRVLFVPAVSSGITIPNDVRIATASSLLG